MVNGGVVGELAVGQSGLGNATRHYIIYMYVYVHVDNNVMDRISDVSTVDR